MSGLLHPVGPGSVRTYWARRALVFGAAMLLAIAVALIISVTSGGWRLDQNPPAGAYSISSPITSMRPAKLQAKRTPKKPG